MRQLKRSVGRWWKQIVILLLAVGLGLSVVAEEAVLPAAWTALCVLAAISMWIDRRTARLHQSQSALHQTVLRLATQFGELQRLGGGPDARSDKRIDALGERLSQLVHTVEVNRKLADEQLREIQALRQGLKSVAPQLDTVGIPPDPESADDAQRRSAMGVSHQGALDWFAGRHAGYVELAECLRPFLPTNGTLLDVGANIGYFSKVVGHELGFEGDAHLFEPVPHLAELCELTMESVGFSASIYPFGLSADDAEVDIYVSDNGNLGWNTMVAGRRTPGMTHLSITVRRFDDLAFDVVPDVIKIDVEGAEYRVFNGMRESLASWAKKPVILCEIGWGVSHPEWADELDAFAFLKAQGYKTFDQRKAPLDVTSLSKTTDVLFLPPHLTDV